MQQPLQRPQPHAPLMQPQSQPPPPPQQQQQQPIGEPAASVQEALVYLPTGEPIDSYGPRHSEAVSSSSSGPQQIEQQQHEQQQQFAAFGHASADMFELVGGPSELHELDAAAATSSASSNTMLMEPLSRSSACFEQLAGGAEMHQQQQQQQPQQQQQQQQDYSSAAESCTEPSSASPQLPESVAHYNSGQQAAAGAPMQQQQQHAFAGFAGAAGFGLAPASSAYFASGYSRAPDFEAYHQQHPQAQHQSQPNMALLQPAHHFLQHPPHQQHQLSAGAHLHAGASPAPSQAQHLAGHQSAQQHLSTSHHQQQQQQQQHSLHPQQQTQHQHHQQHYQQHHQHHNHHQHHQPLHNHQQAPASQLHARHARQAPADKEADFKVCEWEGCDNTFLSMQEFVKHLEERHVNQEPREKNRYFCLWSNCKRNEQEFNARYKLLIHLRVHSGEKPYPCNNSACQKRFSRLENLKIHVRSHTGEKPYKCNFEGCPKSFTNSSDRIKHHKTHKDPKPYSCTFGVCTKRYTDPSSLRKHQRAHKRASAGQLEGPAGLTAASDSPASSSAFCPSDFDPQALIKSEPAPLLARGWHSSSAGSTVSAAASVPAGVLHADSACSMSFSRQSGGSFAALANSAHKDSQTLACEPPQFAHSWAGVHQPHQNNHHQHHHAFATGASLQQHSQASQAGHTFAGQQLVVQPLQHGQHQHGDHPAGAHFQEPAGGQQTLVQWPGEQSSAARSQQHDFLMRSMPASWPSDGAASGTVHFAG